MTNNKTNTFCLIGQDLKSGVRLKSIISTFTRAETTTVPRYMHGRTEVCGLRSDRWQCAC